MSKTLPNQGGINVVFIDKIKLEAFYLQPPTPDLDGDGCPDVCIEITVPGKLVPHKGLDEKGAELLDFRTLRIFS